MALTTTTLNGAIDQNTTLIRVTSGTGFGRNKFLRCDDEEMLQTADADSSQTTLIPVMRGVNGTAAKAHVTGANVVVGTGAEFTGDAVATADSYPLAGRQRRVVSYSASGAITLPSPGTDMVAILNGTSVIAATIADPSKDMDGSLLYIASNGAAAHTATFASGLNNAGSSYDVLTANGTKPVLLGPFMAVNGFWMAPVGVAMAGTVTNITATLS